MRPHETKVLEVEKNFIGPWGGGVGEVYEPLQVRDAFTLSSYGVLSKISLDAMGSYLDLMRF